MEAKVPESGATLLGERWPSVCIICCDKIWEIKLVCGLRCFFFLYLLSDRFKLIRTLHRTPGVVLWQLLAAELLLSK